MSEKHIRLAIFAFMRPAEESLKDKLAAWNRAHSKWRYRQETIFGRDLAAARRRAITTVTDHPQDDAADGRGMAWWKAANHRRPRPSQSRWLEKGR